MFVYRQGENDIKLVDKKIELEELLRYDYIEDLGYNALDKSGALAKETGVEPAPKAAE